MSTCAYDDDARAKAWDNRYTRSQIDRWKSFRIGNPETHTDRHDVCWTGGPGIWHCKDCNEWFRTWDNSVETSEDLEEAVDFADVPTL